MFQILRQIITTRSKPNHSCLLPSSANFRLKYVHACAQWPKLDLNQEWIGRNPLWSMLCWSRTVKPLPISHWTTGWQTAAPNKTTFQYHLFSSSVPCVVFPLSSVKRDKRRVFPFCLPSSCVCDNGMRKVSYPTFIKSMPLSFILMDNNNKYCRFLQVLHSGAGQSWRFGCCSHSCLTLLCQQA